MATGVYACASAIHTPRIVNISYCKEFIELANCLNFTKTAANLHMHQSTLSKHVQALEAELGAPLVNRSGSNLQLTEAGYAFVGYATQLADIYEQAIEQIGFISSTNPIRIDWRLYDQNLVGLISAAFIINNKSERTPVVHHAVPDESPLASVLAGELDLAIVTALKEDIDAVGLASECLTENPLVAIVDETSPLASRDSICIEDLRDETLIHLLQVSARPGWRTIEQLCRRRGFEPKERPVLVAAGPEQLAVPLNGSVLIYPGKEREIKMLSKMAGYAAIPFEDDDAVMSVYACYRSEDAEKLAGLKSVLLEAQALMAT